MKEHASVRFFASCILYRIIKGPRVDLYIHVPAREFDSYFRSMTLFLRFRIGTKEKPKYQELELKSVVHSGTCRLAMAMGCAREIYHTITCTYLAAYM